MSYKPTRVPNKTNRFVQESALSLVAETAAKVDEKLQAQLDALNDPLLHRISRSKIDSRPEFVRLSYLFCFCISLESSMCLLSPSLGGKSSISKNWRNSISVS
jgi:hypothetical protein